MKLFSSSVIKNFYAYQKERFPLGALVPSLIPAVLSSGAIVMTHPSAFQSVLALLGSVLYLLHIRVIDEHRDFIHDNHHHQDRPIQSGIITKKELQIINYWALVGLILIALWGGMHVFFIVAAMLAYSYLAGKEFFVGEGLRSHFFIYNGLNLIQMLLMQLFVYATLAGSLFISVPLALHFGFTSIGTLIFEFARKIKIPGEDGSGKDTYTWYLGFKRALVYFFILAVISSIFFFWLTTLATQEIGIWLVISFLAVINIGIFTYLHARKQTIKTDQLMQLSFLLVYGAFNIIIFFIYA